MKSPEHNQILAAYAMNYFQDTRRNRIRIDPNISNGQEGGGRHSWKTLKKSNTI